MTRTAQRNRRTAAQMGVVLPAVTTCTKYGWTQDDWLAMLASQGWVCPICGEFPRTGKFVQDHEHVRGWSAMPDAERRRYVRGITCWQCNRYALVRGMSPDRARNIATYLEAYAARRDAK